jgi:hypothetical protein
MADYQPIFLEGPYTLQASATITAGQLLVITGAGTVGPAGANAANWVGVAAFDAVSGDKVTVFDDGVQNLVASGSVAAGDLVVAAANGQVSTLAAVTTPTAADVTNSRAIVGVAWSAATNGNKVRIQLAR